MDLRGKAALVTGGNSGIGKAIAFTLARQRAFDDLPYLLSLIPSGIEE